MSVWTVVAFLVGLLGLVAGAEGLVRGASALAARLGLSPVVIGLTVVAFGTSTPEMAVSVSSALDDEVDLALGNVVGSNISNILLILGSSAAVGGVLAVHQKLVRADVPIMIGVSLLTLLFALDHRISRLEGVVLFAGIVSYVAWTVRQARRESATETPAVEAVEEEYEEALEIDEATVQPWWMDVVFLVGGLAILVGGAQLLVDAATDMAEALGVSELVIGLTVVAVGTSLPELATSVVAALRGQRDIAVGNVVGSNIFNLLAVLGPTAMVARTGVPVPNSSLTLDLPVMVVAAFACLPVFVNGYELRRWEGLVFMGFYVLYVVYLVLDATGNGASNLVGAMALFVVPLTVLTFTVVGWRAWRRERAVSLGTSG